MNTTALGTIDDAIARGPRKPLLIGEANPYGGDPEFALYPSPRGCSGWRLCHLVLEMDPDDYCEKFERVNLCPEKWSAPVARKRAFELLTYAAGAPLILLGSKVARSFGLNYQPFTTSLLVDLETKRESKALLLPHPSGLNRAWGVPGAYEQARGMVTGLLGGSP